jgi:hypothetical protein
VNPLNLPSSPCRVRLTSWSGSRGAVALGLGGWLAAWSSEGRAQTAASLPPVAAESLVVAGPPGATEPQSVAEPPGVAAPPAIAGPLTVAGPPVAIAPPGVGGPAPGMESPLGRGYSQALFVDVTVGFVPYANDAPLMLGAGIRFAAIHELWARVGFIIGVGDDRGHTFGSAGYRVALRPGRRVRPLVGGLVAGLGATYTHDALGQPSCTPTPLFIFAATGGVRIEPVPWLGLFGVLTLGTDTYPNPFGMIELGVSFALPQS